MATQTELFKVMQDDAFGVMMDNDPVLAELEREKHNRTDELFALNAVFRGVFKIDGIAIQPITPAVWSFMWCIGNAYARHQEPQPIDTDVFMYVLHTGLRNVEPRLSDLIGAAAGFCGAHQVDYDSVRRDLQEMIYVAFRPLEMLPESGNGGEAVYDADWLVSLAAVVAPLCNYGFDRIIYDTSLTACCYFYIQARRKNDTNGLIRRQSSTEIATAIWNRTLELGEQYYRENYEGK